VRRLIPVVLLAVLAPATLGAPTADAQTPVRASPIVRRLASDLSAVTNFALYADAVAVGVTVAQLRAEWQRVAVCEVGGNWAMTGPRYSGIGILNTTWYEYGGRRFAPLAGDATRDEQIVIGMRVTRDWVPDQDGCSPTGW